MRKNKLAMLSVLALGMMLGMAGCAGHTESKDAADTKVEAEQKTDEAKADEAKTDEAKTDEAKEVSLSDWAGTWNDMSLYLDKPELQKAFDTLAKNENITPEEAKEQYKAKRQNDIGGLVIDGDKITFYDNFKDNGGKVIDEAEYKFEKAQDFQVGTASRTWNIFKATKEDAKFPYMMLMAIDKDEPLVHFHMRYGSDEKEVLDKQKWFPTFVAPDTTDELLIEEIEE